MRQRLMALTKKITGAIVAIAFVLTTIITFAFKSDVKSENKVNKFATQLWYYIPDTAPTGTQIYDPMKYTGSVPENCGGESVVPCEISFTENANYSTLAQYLSYQQSHSLPVNVTSNKDL